MEGAARPDSYSSRRSSKHSNHDARSETRAHSRRRSDTSNTSSTRSAPRRASPMIALERAGGRPSSGSRGRSTVQNQAALAAAGMPVAAAADGDEHKMLRIRRALVVLRLLVMAMGGITIFHVVRGLQKLQAWFPDTNVFSNSFAKYFIMIGSAIIAHILLLSLWIALTVRPNLRDSFCCAALPVRPHTCEIVGDLLWAGVWLAMLVAIYLQRWGYWVNTLCGVLAIAISIATAVLTAWWRLLKDRSAELAAGHVPTVVVSTSNPVAGAPGRKYMATRATHDIV